jgi:hypothetical protein
MTSCNGQCQDLNLDLDQGGKDLKWFKIDAQGYDSSKKTWASQDLIAAGDAWTSTIPKGLKPGQYLLRHEVYVTRHCFVTSALPNYSVALHSNPAQFYPACLQVTVSGSGTNYPSDADTVAIPGLFNDFVWPDIWSDSFNSFTVPGPPVISFDGSTDTASAWSTPAAQPTASVGVVGINGGDSGARPTSDDDGDDYGTTTTTARKAGPTSPAPVAAGTATARPKCVAMANPALARRSSGLKKRLAAALIKHRIRLSLSAFCRSFQSTKELIDSQMACFPPIRNSPNTVGILDR